MPILYCIVSSEGNVPLRNWNLNLKLKSCNLVNTFGCKYNTGDDKNIC